MKKLAIWLWLALTGTLTAPAQQEIFAPRAVAPVVNADGSVTLTLFNPVAKQAQLVFDGIAPQTMTRDSAGVWTVTTPALADGIYRYNFLVDGQKTLDNSNAFTMRDVATVMNTIVVDRSGACPFASHDVPHGNISAVWYPATQGKTRRMMVYTPAGYDDTDARYPVFYLLHGSGGDETAWLEQGRLAQVMDNLIAQGKAVPMIVVMPNGNVDEDAAPGNGSAGQVQPTFDHKQWMEGSFETTFGDITNYVQTHYRVKTGADNTAIAGLSMGGFHSLYISANHPHDFGYVGLFSAAITPRNNPNSPIYANIDAKLATQFAANPRLYWIGIGSDDFLYQENKAFRQQLDAAGCKYVYHESTGGHEWRNWRDYLTLFTPLLFKP